MSLSAVAIPSAGPRPAESGLSGRSRLWILTAAMAAFCAVLLGGFAAPLGPPLNGPAIPWWVIAISFGIVEVFVVHVRLARHAHTFSMAEIPLVVGLAYATPKSLVIGQALGVAVALVVIRRQRPIRVAFNLTQRATTTLLAVFVFNAFVLSSTGWPTTWVAAFVATFLADILSGLLINLAISLSESSRMSFSALIGSATIFTVSNTALGLVATMLLPLHTGAIVLVAAPAAITYLAGRSFADLNRKHDNLQSLYRSTRLAQRTLELESLLPPMLEHAREMLQSEVAEVMLLGDGNTTPLRMNISRSGEPTSLEPVSLDPLEGVWARVVCEGQGVVLPRPISNPRLASYFESQGIRDAIVVPLLADDGVLGTLLVGNRLGDFSTFDGDDGELLETLANHVGVAIRNVSLVRKLEASLAHESEMNRLKGDFIATISHELRTPLTNVQGYLKTLLRPDMEVDSATRQEFLERADAHAQRLRHLIEDLLFASRIEAVPTTISQDEIRMIDLLDRLRDECLPADRKRVRIHVEPPNLMAEASSEHVYRIVRNLVENALKYSPPEQRVDVVARPVSGGVSVTVQDRGAGIPEEEWERIFDRFYQIDQSTTRNVGGAGMGLYICRRAADAIGASVHLERSGRGGSTFSSWFPASTEPDATADVKVADLTAARVAG
jgi:signal transduction histidine kinase